MPHPTATDLVLHVLRKVRADEGPKAAVRQAQEIITAAATILSREIGRAGTLRALRLSATATKMNGGATEKIEPACACGLDARFCELMDAAPVMIWMSGQDKLCTWFNRPWLTFTGRSMEQELGNGWTKGIHPDDFDRCLETYASHFDAQKEFRMQYRLRRHDGVHHWIEDTGIPRHARDGTFLGYIGSCIDIHEHREIQAELHQRLLEIARQAAQDAVDFEHRARLLEPPVTL